MGWSAQWRAVLGTDAVSRRRLEQGRAWDRSGRVTQLRTTPGVLRGRVQGSAATPFAVEINLEPFDAQQWARVLDVLGSQARHHAHLLAGQVPTGLAEQLADLGLHLLPSAPELATECACGDRTWPCLHVAAVWEAAGARLDDDPFLLFALRGRGRQQLLAELAQRRATGSAAGIALNSITAHGWTTSPDDRDILLPAPEQPVSGHEAPLLRLLGDPPGWEGRVSAWDVFAPLVAQAADAARAAIDVAEDDQRPSSASSPATRPRRSPPT